MSNRASFYLSIILPLCIATCALSETYYWQFSKGNGNIQYVEVPEGSGQFALECWNDLCNWNTYFCTTEPFPRGNNLRCTFRWWWDPIPGGGHSNNYVAITGPWHSSPAGTVKPYQDSEAMIDRYIFEDGTSMRWSESGTVQSGPDLELSFNDALYNANSRATSVLIRVYLGDTAGGKVMWSDDDGATWNQLLASNGVTPIDTIGMTMGQSLCVDSRCVSVSGSPEAYAGFAPGYQAHTFFADIVIENDLQVFELATPNPDLALPSLTIDDITPQGQYYSADVPDTLDLAKHAEYAVRGLTNFLDASDYYSTYCHTYYNTNPPYMTRHYAGGRPQNWGKITDGIILMRSICGSTENLDIELATINGMVNFASYSEAYPVPLSRIMISLMSLREKAPMAEIDQLLGDMAQAHRNVAQYHDDLAWFYDRVPDTNDTALGVQNYGMHVFINGTITRAMSRWYEISADPDYYTFAGQLKNWLFQPVFWEPETWPKAVTPQEHGHFSGHHHSYCQAYMGLLWRAEQSNDARLKTFIREGYEYLRTFGIARIGAFGEACTTGDMTYLAIKLSQLGIGDYWEDVDQYVRNHLVELQYRDRARMQAFVDQMPPLDPGQEVPTVDYYSNDIIDRAEGIWFSDSGHPALIPEHTMLSVVCCTGNCSRALYEAWNAVVGYDNGQAKVNLLLNRASPWLDINSYLPYEGKVVINNKTANKISVRIPLWADKQAVTCKINGEQVNFEWYGRYICVEALRSGDVITIEFPIVESTQDYTLKWKENDFWKESTDPGSNWQPESPPDVWTCRFKGNTLVEISPRPQLVGYSLYQDRTRYDQPSAPIVSVVRFVSDYDFSGECVDKPKADLDNNCKVDFKDISIFANEWMHNGEH